MAPTKDNPMQFDINGKTYDLPNDLEADLPLCDYLRDHAHLKGTKITCREGGCGACTVSATMFDPVAQSKKTIAINSCLRPVYSCLNMKINTVEGIGNKKTGYHPVQERLAEYNGTQCGFCSPGMVMNMYSLLQNNSAPPVQDIENLLDGNLCRCTGYRPILDAFKSFAGPSADGKQQRVGPCEKRIVQKQQQSRNLHVSLPTGQQWFHPLNLPQLYEILNLASNGAKIRLVVGNTSTGIYKYDGPFDIYVDMQGVYELYEYKSGDEVSFGGSVSLNHLISILSKLDTHPYYKSAAKHLKKIANVAVRNVGSWAGNLMIKHAHPDFPSDAFIVLECLGAQLTISDYSEKTLTVTPKELLGLDMTGKVILKMVLPKLTAAHKYNSYKIMPRMQNSHACTNAAFLMQVDTMANYKVVSTPSIVLGGLKANFDHASKTEQFLTGKELGNVQVLQGALKVLGDEIEYVESPELTSGIYRKNLALHLFYKYVVGMLPNDIVSGKFQSAASAIPRPVSSGKQTYETNKSDWPVNEPIKKLEAKAQCSGEAEYIPDIPRPPGTVYGAFAITDVGNAMLAKIDAKEALSTPGVLGFLTTKDIPGINNVVPNSREFFFPDEDELFCSGMVLYAGQAVGLIVAETWAIAQRAAKLVKIEYTVLGPPVLTIQEGIAKGSVTTLTDEVIKEGDVSSALQKAKHVLKGEVEVGTQQHFHMETQVCLTIPTEDGFEVSASTQWLDATQQAISQVLGVNRSSVHLQLRRLGGAFGGKVTRNLHTAAASALAANHFNRPVYLQMDLQTNLEMMGRRNPFLAKYQVGFDDQGKLGAVKLDYYMDYGCNNNEPSLMIVMMFTKNVYTCDNWLATPAIVKTNLPTNTYCRTPGSVKAVFTIEAIMEHIAKFLKMDPMKVKLVNMPLPAKQLQLDPSSRGIRDFFLDVQRDAGVEERLKEIAVFNQKNRWNKRGLSLVPMKYPVGFHMAKFNALVSIYNDGGSVAVVHGGVECGQGINTKVAQVCAFELGIPLSLVTVRSTNTMINPNGSGTVAATTSELCSYTVAECCKELLNRIKPVRDKMKDPTWAELINACFNSHVDLSARFMCGPPRLPKGYSIYGVTCAEAEINVLTGEWQIRRVDLHYDCGQSLSPEVDIGQMEGAFVMGMGLMLLEQVKFDPKTGQNVTAGTWEYHLPTTKDIPVDFRVTMLQNSKNPFGVLKSKTAGEPPLCMSVSVLLAIQNAIHAARSEVGDTKWFPLSAPATTEVIQLACSVKPEQLVYKESGK